MVKELDRIEEFADANYSALPHRGNIPEDLRPPISVDFPIWTCDANGLCLTGENADSVISINDIRAHYKLEYGGVEQFKEKVLKEIEERNKRLEK